MVFVMEVNVCFILPALVAVSLTSSYLYRPILCTLVPKLVSDGILFLVLLQPDNQEIACLISVPTLHPRTL